MTFIWSNHSTKTLSLSDLSGDDETTSPSSSDDEFDPDSIFTGSGRQIKTAQVDYRPRVLTPRYKSLSISGSFPPAKRPDSIKRSNSKLQVLSGSDHSLFCHIKKEILIPGSKERKPKKICLSLFHTEPLTRETYYDLIKTKQEMNQPMIIAVVFDKLKNYQIFDALTLKKKFSWNKSKRNPLTKKKIKSVFWFFIRSIEDSSFTYIPDISKFTRKLRKNKPVLNRKKFFVVV